MTTKNEDILFFKVFRNVYLNKLIFENLKILKENEIVTFDNKERMRKYKDRDFIDTIIYKGDEILEIGDFPSNGVLRVVKLPSYSHYRLIDVGLIPNSVQDIWFSKKLKLAPNLNKLPSSITAVNDYYFKNNKNNNNYKDEEMIPNNIKSLSISYESLSSIDDELNLNSNKTLISLNLCHWNNNGFSMKTNIFPINLKRLFINRYCEPITLKDQLPKNLEELEIGSSSIDFFKESVFPESLKSLLVNFISIKFDSIIELTSNNIKNVEKLSISTTRSILSLKPFSLPNNLNFLECNHFKIMNFNCDDIDCDNIFPKNLKTFNYNGNIYLNFPKLPQNLESLSFSSQYSNDTLPPLPINLKTLKLNPSYNRKFKKGFLPNSLEHLILGISFNHPFPKGSLPCNLKSLIFPSGSKFSYVFDRAGILPNSLTTLIIPSKSKLDISDSSDIEDPIPKSVKYLKFIT